MKAQSLIKSCLVGFAALACASCGGGSAKPRTLNAINEERVKLPALYMTEDGAETTVPGDSGNAVILGGKLAYPTFVCKNPQCTGKGKSARPYLFVWKDPFAYLKKDGTLGIKEIPRNEDPNEWIRKQGSHPVATCPACLKRRNLKGESVKERAKYAEWCEPYVLPQTAARLTELQEEEKSRKKYMKDRWEKDAELDDFKK